MRPAGWSAMRSRNFRLLLTGQLLSFLGDGVSLAVVTSYVVLRNGSPLGLAAVLLSQFLPAVVFSLPAGRLADRASKQRIMIRADLVRAVLAFLMAGLLAAGLLPVAGVAVLSALSAVAAAFLAPAFAALTRELLADQDLLSGNAVIALGRPLMGRVLGAGLGAALLFADAFAFGIALNGLSFLIGAGCVAAIRLQACDRAPAGEPPIQRGALWWAVPRPPVRLAAPVALMLAGDVLVLLLYWGPYQVHAMFALRAASSDPGPAIGAFLAAGGLGAVLGSLLAPFLRRVGSLPLLTQALWLLGACAPVAWAFASSLPAFLMPAVVANLCFTVGNVLFTSVLQARVPQTHLGRMFGFVYFLENLVVPVSVLGEGLIPASQSRSVLLVTGVASALCMTVLVTLTARASAAD